MNTLTLVIGNKNYSSWSMRPWLALKQLGVPFEEIKISLYTATSRAESLRHSPSGKVPVLRDGAITVWDSLAICEYLAERFPEAELWPRDPAARAYARSICAEMHSGFMNLRQHMSMNCRKHLPGKGRAPGVFEEIARITEIWRDCRARFGAKGPMLFGRFSIADAFYAPVTCRFVTYGVELDPVSQAYVNTIQSLPTMREWLAAARAETEVIEKFELY